MLHSEAKQSRDMAILTRAIQPNKHNLPVSAARALLRIVLDPQDRERLHELLVNNQKDALTRDERAELDSYLHIGLVIDLLQAKARASLRAARSRVAANG
jgi:hypothetical protein